VTFNVLIPDGAKKGDSSKTAGDQYMALDLFFLQYFGPNNKPA